ncbi:MAG: hypothetical protein EBZ74_12625, partial [Planctomycetia bacterium]|nr:hypothetical protein [Planctomycetia bacterium]
MPQHADPAKFFFSAAGARYLGKLVDVSGAKVLVLAPTTEPEPEKPSFLSDAPLELDVRREEGAALPPDAAGTQQVLRPRVAEGTIQIDKLLTAAVKSGVSDIHITAGIPPVFRIDGHMRPQATKVLTADDTNGLMKSITPERCQAELAEKGGSDFGFAFGDMARFRVSVFKQRGTVAMVLRQIPNKMLTPEQLGVPDVCKRMVTRPRGLFLVTGPTGSGKSTTLASLIDFINKNYEHHII